MAICVNKKIINRQKENNVGQIECWKSGYLEVAIIGAGAAGLSAALFLVRARRKIVLFDGGKKRISSTEKIHELIGFEGVIPKDFHARAENEIEMYGGKVKKENVTKIEPIADNFFNVYILSGTLTTRTVIIATG